MYSKKPNRWHIGIIGGSGLAGGIDLEDAQEIEVASPFGQPSGPVTTGKIGGVRFSFIARHGAGHSIPPGDVNYRANIDVLKRSGVTDILALSAIGSLREEMAPGDFVAIDQLIDRTVGRTSSFFGPGCVAHVSLADPICPRMAAMAQTAVKQSGGKIHMGGCYIAIEGPQFSTRAESHLYRGWGADVIGMTAMPEARLAREAELPYALLGMITDWDCWRDDQEEVVVSDVLAAMSANAELARNVVAALASKLPKEREPSLIDHALEYAIVTAPDARDTDLLSRLDAIAGRVLAAETES